MENRISYRIWIEKEKKMYYHDTKNNNFVLNCKGQVVKFGYTGDRCGEALFVVKILEDEEYKLMKSIGVKDEEGKLIYEKDIAEEKDDFGHTEIKIVEYNNKRGKCNLNFEEEWQDMSATIKTKYSHKIKGNVYENMELLEGKNGK